MAIDYVQNAWRHSDGSFLPTQSVTFSALSVTTGHSIIVAIVSSGSVQGVSDNKGNTYSLASRVDVFTGSLGHPILNIWYSPNVVGGSNLTVTAQLFGPNTCDMWAHELAATVLKPLNHVGEQGILRVAETAIVRSGSLFAPLDVVSYAVFGMNRGGEHGGPHPERTGQWEFWFSDDSYMNKAEISIGRFVNEWYYGEWQCTLEGSTWSTLIQAFYEDVSANFTGTPLTGTDTLTVDFTDASSGDPDSWEWFFGDNTTSSAQHPSHTYTAPGIYDVTLRVRRGTLVNTLTRTAYVEVEDSGGDPPPPGGGGGTPTLPGIPESQGNSYASLAGSFGLLLQAWMNLPPGILSPASPEPIQTAAEVEQEILILRQLQQLVQTLSAESAAQDAPRLEAAMRAAARVLDGFFYTNQLQLVGENDYRFVTQGWADAEVPTSADAGEDGMIWIAWNLKYENRRDRMPVDPDGDAAATVWVCVVQDDGTPEWFEVEAYPPGPTDTSPDAPTTSGATGTF